MFNSGLEIGQIIKNEDTVRIFKCGNNAETWEVCAVQEQRIHLLSYQIIQKVFITISGSVGFYIIQAWANQVIRIFIGRSYLILGVAEIINKNILTLLKIYVIFII